MKTIEVIVARTGETRIETRGFAGDECRQAAAYLRQSLGVAIGEHRTAEAYQAAISERTRHTN